MSDPRNQYTEEILPAEQLMQMVRKVVSRYAAKGSIPKREIPDAEMAVFGKFWDNREKILNAFEGRSQLKTYCISVANRMCCEFIRKEKKHWNQLHENFEFQEKHNSQTHQYETAKEVTFDYELQRLSGILQFFNGESAKLKLFLKYYFNIPICETDVEAYHPDGRDSVLDMLTTGDTLVGGEKFKHLAGVVNLVENKEVKSDAVRLWLNNRMNKLIYRLNGQGDSNHDHESLKFLMELMHQNERKEKLNRC